MIFWGNKVNQLLSVGAVFFLLIVVGGCEARRMVYSEPYVDAAGVEKSKDGMFTLTGLNFMVVPHNSDISYGVLWYVVPIAPLPGRSESEGTQTFTITLILDPEGEQFSFDLKQVVLEMNGKKYSPSYFWGPVGRVYYQGGGWSCNINRDSNSGLVKNFFTQPLPIPEWSCFSVKFDTPTPSPEESFIVYLNGVFRDKKPFPATPIHFRKNVGWQMHRDL
jgi:hypothetical protein